ncbi:ligase-associated DNA damage response endonuclease PdeM [Microvirga pudoricolor]|uniref:ligase-associated DNA damage response endonuclease PdeM n=1 Tax=Microvirga pudoricolor TaxID=2778729 RepID=UPI001E2E3389|nr:ligase-associated DNA damage response endonuclease PdeM [Microvirga pudoricolor]
MAAILDLSGAMYLPDEDTLLVADLHFEKGSSYARRGMLLPPYDTRETLAALSEVIFRLGPRRVVALGDSFHDVGGPDRLGGEERETLGAVQSGRDWVWVTGNHDRSLPDHIGGTVVEDMEIRDLILRHEPKEGATGEVAGHLHPVGKVVMRGRATRRRCFLSDGARCIMPAIGAYTGGLNACDAVYKPLFPKGFTAYLIGTERIFAIARAMLCRD